MATTRPNPSYCAETGEFGFQLGAGRSMNRKPTKNPAPDPLLKIGDKVEVMATITVFRDTDYESDGFTKKGPLRRKMERKEIEPAEMIVVGARRRLLGEVRVGCHYHTMDGDDYDPGYLVVEESVFVYQVRRGLMRRIEEALPDDVKLKIP